MNVYQNLTNFNRGIKEVKRKSMDPASVEKIRKKIKLNSSSSRNLNSRSPLGLTWDEKDYSCAYDSLLTVLHHIWDEGQLKHKAYFANGNEWIRMLNSKFTSLSEKKSTFKSIRNFIRAKLNHMKPSQYRYGRHYTDICELISEFTSAKTYVMSHLYCRNCKSTVEKKTPYFSDYTVVGHSSSDREILKNTASIQVYLDYKIIKNNEKSIKTCLKCRNSTKKDFHLYDTQDIEELPTVLMFALAPWIDINQRLQFDVSNSTKRYILKGIIYSNNDHFTSRLIDENLTVWYHDGQTTRQTCQEENSLIQTDEIAPLKTYGQYKAILAFYVEK
jgi:hypothetical protein